MSNRSSVQRDVRDGDSEPPRKRVRKGTKSCWECKRRKIKCQLSTEDVAVCSGCRSRGTTCLSQEYPEEHDSSSGTNVGERLGRVELLLEKLVAKMSAYEEEEHALKIATPESMSNDVITPFTASISVTDMRDDGPILSHFKNDVLGRRDDFASVSQITTPVSSTSVTRAPSCRMTKRERLRQTLSELLPSQRDLNIICEKTSCWMLVYTLRLNDGAVTVFDHKNQRLLLANTFNLADLGTQDPTIIARSLLYVVVCLQQLPPEFDIQQIHLGTSLDARMDKIMSTVTTLVTSDDELISSIEGVECLMIQGVFHINGGNPRRAWMYFRRAISVCQLIGLHKSPVLYGREKKNPWHQIIYADRYLALLLGLPAGCSDTTFAPDESFQNPDIDKDHLFMRKISAIAAQIIERNQSENTQAYGTTQAIDDSLESLAKQMPASWWVVPPYLAPERTPQAAVQFERLLVQIWYYQMEALLHMPFMLRSTIERRYEYSRIAALKASKNMLQRYLALRRVENKGFCCKIVDFGALTATVTLFLGLLHPSDDSKTSRDQRDSDRLLIEAVLRTMEEIADGGKYVVATQSVNVIRTLLAVDTAPTAKTSLRLVIPFFGTINIGRPADAPTEPNLVSSIPVQQHPYPEQRESWQDMQYTPQDHNVAPFVQFQSSHFAPLPLEQTFWDVPGADTLYFDSLMNSDIEGSWFDGNMGKLN